MPQHRDRDRATWRLECRTGSRRSAVLVRLGARDFSSRDSRRVFFLGPLFLSCGFFVGLDIFSRGISFPLFYFSAFLFRKFLARSRGGGGAPARRAGG